MHLTWPSLIEVFREKLSPSLTPHFYRWSSRILRRRLPCSAEPRQERIYGIGYSLVKERLLDMFHQKEEKQ